MMLTDLRNGTRAQHESLEQKLNILDPQFSRERYSWLLRRFYGFYGPIESIVPAYGDEPSDWIDGDRRKLALLAKDLNWAGCESGAIATLPRCEALPELTHSAQQLGCMYVLEGSTLGGQVVLRHVRQLLGVNGRGGAFFGSYGARVGPMWRAFCARLEGLAPSDAVRRTVVDSACATFSALDRWLFADAEL